MIAEPSVLDLFPAVILGLGTLPFVAGFLPLLPLFFFVGM